MATEHFDIQPEDGWVAITSAGVDFIKINYYPCNMTVFITTGSVAPAADEIGYRLDKDFYCDVPVADTFYARVVNPAQPEGTRVYVFTVPTPGP